jgi:hypothetical protein
MTLFCFQHIKDFEDLVRTVVTLCDQEEQVSYVKKRTDNVLYIHRSMYCIVQRHCLGVVHNGCDDTIRMISSKSRRSRNEGILQL